MRIVAALSGRVLTLAACTSGTRPGSVRRWGDQLLHHRTLTNLGYNPDEIDGYFGENTLTAAAQEVLDNGNVNGPNGVFEEYFPDDGAILPAAFQRLGIAC